ncbi:MAG TPA: serine hydrolase [Gemmataceae bacterium]|nr:serine hydrolase [Gemmataceae bacterium]
MRRLAWVGVVGLLLAPTARAEAPKAALANYFPPPESQGGWRSLLPKTGEPGAEEKAALRAKAGVDWDKLKEAWQHAATAEGASGLLVIRKGHVVGEWYKDGNAAKTFNIYSSSKAYTSLAFGLALADSAAGKLPGGKKLTLDTKVCNKEWLPESLPLPDPRKAEITLRELLQMASGLGPENVPGRAPFETALGHTEGSPFAKLKADPGAKFFYSNAGVAHLVLVFHNATGQDLFPFLKERVFGPVGMERVSWLKIGGNGKIGPYCQGFSGVLTTPREHARFCHLALHKGNWAGKQVVPAAHYDFAWTPSKANKTYGAQWWLEPRHPGAPPDMIQTAGAFNNNGYVVPSLDLVFVRLGDGRQFPRDWEQALVRKVLAAVGK